MILEQVRLGHIYRGASLSSGLDLPTSGGPLRVKNRNIPEGGIRLTLNIKNIGFAKV